MQPITPPFEEDGHDVLEYKEVWSKLGTADDLKNLVKEAHKRKMKVMLDVVLNHSSEEHPFVKSIQKKGKILLFMTFTYTRH